MASTSIGKVFISYRREDAADIAGRIHDWLIRRIPEDDVFMDVTHIPFGALFMQVIEQTISQCRAMIVVISPTWLSAVNDPTSYVRAEAELGLRRNILVIPVLVGGAQLPPAAQLPEGVRALTQRNVGEVRAGRDFEPDIAAVGRSLGIQQAPSPGPVPAPRAWQAPPMPVGHARPPAAPAWQPLPPSRPRPAGAGKPVHAPFIITGAVVALLALVFLALALTRGGQGTTTTPPADSAALTARAGGPSPTSVPASATPLPPPTNTPEELIDGFCGNLEVENYQLAYDMYSQQLQEQVSFTDFVNYWSAHNAQYYSIDRCDHQTIPTPAGSIHTSKAPWSTHEFYSAQVRNYLVTFIVQGNVWKIDRIDPA
jgi:TIR domain